MFANRKHHNTELNEAIDKIFAQMKDVSPTDATYDEMIGQLERLYDLQKNESARRISPDTVATVAANLVGIVLILRHEQVNVIASKAMSFVQKLH